MTPDLRGITVRPYLVDGAVAAVVIQVGPWRFSRAVNDPMDALIMQSEVIAYLLAAGVPSGQINERYPADGPETRGKNAYE